MSALVPTPNGLRRKLAIATWAPPREGNIYGKLTVDVSEALRWIDAVRAQSGEKVTLTHLVGKAVAEAFAQAPGLNGVIRLGTYQRHQGVALSFLIALEEGQNLAKAKIDDFDKKSVVEVARELRGLTSAGKKARGLRGKGHRYTKNAPSKRANWKKHNSPSLRRYR